ncbi:MAG: (Na+)-NQR maturation NqrM [Gammaproteobacteria bacterium]|nr:(Na+)-NQR maturation NqrM [Gammaproteobacteria bacterium]
MAAFFASLVVFGLVMAGMAIGVMVSGRRIAGSCGGIGNIPGFEKPNCSCKKPCEKRQKAMSEAAHSE